MRVRCLCLCLLAACPGTPPVRADAAPPSVIPTLELTTGRVLHHVKVISVEPDSLIVNSDEGLVKVAKSTLPPSVPQAAPSAPEASSGPQMVMQPFNPAPAADIAGAPTPKPTPKVKPTPAPRPERLVSRGLTIVSFTVKPFQNVLGCAQVVIHNDTPNPVGIAPSDLAAYTDKGARYVGRKLVADGYPPIVRRGDVVPPGGDLADIVTFTNSELPIASVQWTR